MSHRSQKAGGRANLVDNARFIRQWIENPRLIGAVSPSGRALAKTMAGFVELEKDGLIIELGPGTGPVTQALISRGIAPERLVLVEYETRFCHLLSERFPGVNIVQGDAYGLKATLAGKVPGKIATVVSSLPLLNRPERDRVELLNQSFEMMGDDGLFIQFTYGLTKSPMPMHAHGVKGAYVGKGSPPIVLNIPPARVWRYRKAGHTGKPRA
ncbi:class I SAM-dependent methyltransferase [Methylocystis sp.]|uniref:class I SAM-dependent methyltransferase n=1 Tax=Methylocystis sp. TaxID=1911079 RepID=UPI0025FCC5F5|nr:rRNA adenine N-6-methyltransferase family protein [Methylocystis sp.]